MLENSAQDRDIPAPAEHDASRQKFLDDALPSKLSGKGAEHIKAADDDLDKPANLVVSVVSGNGNFGGKTTRELIGDALQSASKDGRLENFAQRINDKLFLKTPEADYRVVAYTVLDKVDNQDKKVVVFDLHKDSVTDGMSLVDPPNTKLEPLKEDEVAAAAKNIASIISTQGGLGDKDQRKDIQTTFLRAKQSDLVDTLATQVGQELAKTGDPEYYVEKREQFKDSKGNPIPELVLHLKETADSVAVPSLSPSLQVPADTPACAIPEEIRPSLFHAYWNAKDAEGTKVDTGIMTEKLTLANGTVLESFYTIGDMNIINQKTGQNDTLIAGNRQKSQWVTNKDDGTSVQAIANFKDEQATQEIGFRMKGKQVVSSFNDLFRPDGTASRLQCKDAQGKITYDKSF